MLYRNRYILLVTGIVLAILFLMFSGKVYYRLYYGNPYTEGLNEFRTELNIGGIGFYLSLLIMALSWGAAIVYYYVVDSVKFDRWMHWALIALALMVATPIAGYFLVESSLNRLSPGLGDADSELNVMLQLWTSLIVLAWYFTASYSIRWWSRNCRHTPMPQ